MKLYRYYDLHDDRSDLKLYFLTYNYYSCDLAKQNDLQ